MKYEACACQLALESSFDAEGTFLPSQVTKNLEHTREVVMAAGRSSDCRLFVLPQFSVQGFSAGRSVEQWCTASAQIPGSETRYLGALAKDANAYLAGTIFEVIPEFPGRHFLTGFVIAPSGDVILKYRKLYAFSTKTRPGDVYQRYVELYGREALFPVVDTPLGRLGMAIAGDVHWPEMPRALALRGAEVILNPTGSGLSAEEAATAVPYIRRVRAFENLAYVVLANVGPLHGVENAPETRLRSEIIDYTGRPIASASTDAETVITASIDLVALREHRQKPMCNFLAQLQPQLHAPDYAEADLWALNQWADRPLTDPRKLFDVEARISRRLASSPTHAFGAKHP